MQLDERSGNQIKEYFLLLKFQKKEGVLLHFTWFISVASKLITTITFILHLISLWFRIINNSVRTLEPTNKKQFTYKISNKWLVESPLGSLAFQIIISMLFLFKILMLRAHTRHDMTQHRCEQSNAGWWLDVL